MTRFKSRNQLCTRALRACILSTAREFKLTGERPGVHERHIRQPEYTASTRHSSILSGTPPSEVTTSTKVRQAWRRAICTSVATSDAAPVEVSAWTKATILVSG